MEVAMIAQADKPIEPSIFSILRENVVPTVRAKVIRYGVKT